MKNFSRENCTEAYIYWHKYKFQLPGLGLIKMHHSTDWIQRCGDKLGRERNVHLENYEYYVYEYIEYRK